MLVSRECFLKREEERGKMGQVVRGNVSIRFSAFKNPETGGIWT